VGEGKSCFKLVLIKALACDRSVFCSEGPRIEKKGGEKKKAHAPTHARYWEVSAMRRELKVHFV